MQKRELLSSFRSAFGSNASKAGKETRMIRPPYNQDRSLFHKPCQECDARCAAVCEEEIIVMAEDKTPYLSFEKSGCTFCDACANACDFGVLTLAGKSDISAVVSISVSSCLSWNTVCLSWNTVMCFACKDPCLEDAIVFQGLFKPVIDETKCTACGFCISRCPASAIEIESVA